jgi:hypothetical protein
MSKTKAKVLLGCIAFVIVAMVAALIGCLFTAPEAIDAVSKALVAIITVAAPVIGILVVIIFGGPPAGPKAAE